MICEVPPQKLQREILPLFLNQSQTQRSLLCLDKLWTGKPSRIYDIGQDDFWGCGQEMSKRNTTMKMSWKEFNTVRFLSTPQPPSVMGYFWIKSYPFYLFICLQWNLTDGTQSFSYTSTKPKNSFEWLELFLSSVWLCNILAKLILGTSNNSNCHNKTEMLPVSSYTL